MSIEADLKAHLGAALSSLIGERLWPAVRDPDDETLPAVTYQVIANDQNESLEGRATTLRHFRVQLDIWAETYSDALALDAALRSRMDTAATTFRSTMLPSGFGDYEPDTRLHRRTLEFSIWHTET